MSHFSSSANLPLCKTPDCINFATEPNGLCPMCAYDGDFLAETEGWTDEALQICKECGEKMLPDYGSQNEVVGWDCPRCIYAQVDEYEARFDEEDYQEFDDDEIAIADELDASWKRYQERRKFEYQSQHNHLEYLTYLREVWRI